MKQGEYKLQVVGPAGWSFVPLERKVVAETCVRQPVFAVLPAYL